MLHLILGEVGSGKTVLLDRMIAETVRNKNERELQTKISAYLIVPEQSTVAAERRMAESPYMPPYSPLVFEATNFTRLADSFFRSEGGLTLRYATGTARALAMWRALRELTPPDAAGSASADRLSEVPDLNPASLDRYLSVVRELTAGRIDEKKLGEAAAAVGDARLSRRLRDVSLILSTYRRILDERYADAENVLDVLAKQMRGSDFFAGTAFFFDSFTGFTEQQYAVIAALLPSVDLTVTLPLPERPEDSLCYEEPVATRDRLIRMAESARVGWDERKLGGNRRAHSEAIRYLTANLFASDLEKKIDPDCENDGSVRIVEAGDPYDASRFVAADILKKVAEEGALYRDFAILSGDPELYRGILDAELSKNGIPFFFSQRTDLSTLEPLKLVTSAYRAVTGNFRRSDVISVVKCGFSGLTERESDELELYSEIWSLTGDDFRRPAKWEMNPDGFSEKRGETSDGEKARYTARWLDGVNAAKEKVLIPLRKLAAASAFPRSLPVPDHCRAICDFLFDLSVPDQLKDRAKRAAEDGDPERAELYGRFWEVALSALDTLAEMFSDVSVTAEEFSTLFDLVCRTSDVGRIPSYWDEVTVGSADLLRAGGVRFVYLFGANEGEFPGIVRGSGYFSEYDRARLAEPEIGITIGGGRKMRASRQLFNFLRAVSAPTASVAVVTNGLSSDLVSQRTPSSAVLRMKALLPNAIETVRTSDLPPLFFIRSREEAIAGIGRLYRRDPLYAPLEKTLSDDPEGASVIAAAKRPISNAGCELSEEVAKEVFHYPLTLSHSRLETYHNCPFSYFCEKVLNLREIEEATFGANDIGSYVHAMLKAFFDCRERGAEMMGPQEIRTLTEQCSREYLEKVGQGMETTPRLSYLIEKLRFSTELLIQHVQDELSEGDFGMSLTELPLALDGQKGGPGDLPTALRVETGDGGALYVNGTIDRVDAAKIGDDVYLRVIDYKTGKKKLDLNAIEKGETPQLLLYLSALLNNRNPAFAKRLGVEMDRVHPAAVRYLHAVTEKVPLDEPLPPDEVRKKYEESITTNGCLLDDGEVIDAMDHTSDRRFLPELKSTRSKKKVLVSEERFREMLEKIEENLRGDVARMRSGDLPATPGDDACRYCGMAAICRKDRQGGTDADD